MITLVHKYNQLMKDFPLNELLSATDVEKIRESLFLIFAHLNKKLKLSYVQDSLFIDAFILTGLSS